MIQNVYVIKWRHFYWLKSSNSAFGQHISVEFVNFEISNRALLPNVIVSRYYFAYILEMSLKGERTQK